MKTSTRTWLKLSFLLIPLMALFGCSNSTSEGRVTSDSPPAPTPESMIKTPAATQPDFKPPTRDPARETLDGWARLEGEGVRLWVPDTFQGGSGEDLAVWLAENRSALNSDLIEKASYFETDLARVPLLAMQIDGDQLKSILTVQRYDLPPGLGSRDFIQGITSRLPETVSVAAEYTLSYQGDIAHQVMLLWIEVNVQQILTVIDDDDQSWLMVVTSSAQSRLLGETETGMITFSLNSDQPPRTMPIELEDQSNHWIRLRGAHVSLLVPSSFVGGIPGEELDNILKDLPVGVKERASLIQENPSGIEIWAYDPGADVELHVRVFIPADPRPLADTLEHYYDRRTGGEAGILVAETPLESRDGERVIHREIFRDDEGVTIRYWKPRKGLIGGVGTVPSVTMYAFLPEEDLDTWLAILDEIAMLWEPIEPVP